MALIATYFDTTNQVRKTDQPTSNTNANNTGNSPDSNNNNTKDDNTYNNIDDTSDFNDTTSLNTRCVMRTIDIRECY